LSHHNKQTEKRILLNSISFTALWEREPKMTSATTGQPSLYTTLPRFQVSLQDSEEVTLESFEVPLQLKLGGLKKESGLCARKVGKVCMMPSSTWQVFNIKIGSLNFYLLLLLLTSPNKQIQDGKTSTCRIAVTSDNREIIVIP